MTQQPDTIVDISEHALREAARKVHAVRPGVESHTALAVIQALLVMGWRPPAMPLAQPRWRCNTTERCLLEDGHDGPHGYPVTAYCLAEHAEPRTAAGHPAHTPGDSQ